MSSFASRDGVTRVTALVRRWSNEQDEASAASHAFVRRDLPFPLAFRRLKTPTSRTAAATKANPSKGGSVADTFSAAALDIDGEITELRSQLAQKADQVISVWPYQHPTRCLLLSSER